jgi:hypothetical protein
MIVGNDSNSYKSTATTDERYQGATGGKQFKTYGDEDGEMMHSPRNTDIDILIRNCKRRTLTDSRHK